jgi:hypothetical protein
MKLYSSANVLGIRKANNKERLNVRFCTQEYRETQTSTPVYVASSFVSQIIWNICFEGPYSRMR